MKIEGIIKNKEIDYENLSDFGFRKLKNGYLITNDFGYFHYLKEREFLSFLKGSLKNKKLKKQLEEKGFLKKDLTEMKPLFDRLTKRKSVFNNGPGLHIIVTTKRCNHNCIYCQASAQDMSKDDLDMSIETAKKTVDRIFESPADNLTIEFQGGEPMANWETVKYIVEYGRKKEQKTGKNLSFALITNLTLMTEKRLNFLVDKSVGICTSLDGPKELHNNNRPFAGNGNGYDLTVKWINRYKEKEKEVLEEGTGLPIMNALVTVSAASLNYPKEIINEYLKHSFKGIHLRPLSYLGYSSGSAIKDIGYNVDRFFEFWKKGLEYIIDLNLEGIYFHERETRIILKKIMTAEDPGYTDLMSPCGAVRGQILYNYNGDIYTCDEGRMTGDEAFKIGNLEEDSYEDMVQGDVAQTVFSASTLENTTCDLCVYKPYCGICPVKNYSEHGTLFPKMKSTDWCKLKTSQFDYLFEKLDEEKYRKVFEKWTGSRQVNKSDD